MCLLQERRRRVNLKVANQLFSGAMINACHYEQELFALLSVISKIACWKLGRCREPTGKITKNNMPRHNLVSNDFKERSF